MTAMKQHASERGQSLVEVALFAPIFIILIIGLIEISQLVITQNRIATAGRNAARFGANGGEDDGMAVTALNTITQTLDTNEARWDMWAIRGVVNGDGSSIVPDSWSFEHVYGISNTKRFSDVVELELQQRVLAELRTDQFGDANNPNNIAAGERFVASYIIHDANSLLELSSLPSLTSLNVMRVAGGQAEQTNGCSAFPIGVSVGTRSVTEETFPSSGYSYPPIPPDLRRFSQHEPDRPLDETAREGYVYRFSPAGYTLLVWNLGIPNDDAALVNSLSWPGNSQDYVNHGDIGAPLGDFGYVVRGYLEPGDATDKTMHRRDWLAQSNSGLGAVAGILNGHIDVGRVLRLPVYAATDANLRQIAGFANFRLLGYGGDGWLLMELISWDDSCGIIVE